jgi:pimeloyl-ACP methyl ester carboxylesterase
MAISSVKIDGGSLSVDVVGEGPLIVCSPAMGDTRDAFLPLADHLVAKGYRVARVDLRGHGDSTAQFARYGDEATADDFLAVIEALGGSPAVLAGASMSAASAVIAAGRRPDQVAGLVLLAPFLRNGAPGMVRWIMRIALLRPWGPYVWKRYAATLWPGLDTKARERATITTDLLTRPGRWRAFHTTSSALDHSVVAPWIDHVKAPVLVVMGEADPDWKDPLAEAKWVASNFADVEALTVPGVGHAPMFERPNIVGPVFVEFVEKLRRRGAFEPSKALGGT